MPTCRICLRAFKSLKFQNEHISICTRCVNTLNEHPEPAQNAEARLAEKLARGMRRTAERNLQSDEEWKRRKAQQELENLNSAVAERLHDWITRLLKDPNNTSRDFKVMRAYRRNLLRKEGYAERPSETVWKRMRQEAIERDGKKCMACGIADWPLDVHHIIYLSHHGTNQKYNLITLCRKCHEAEHDRTFDTLEWSAQTSAPSVQRSRQPDRLSPTPQSPQPAAPPASIHPASDSQPFHKTVPMPRRQDDSPVDGSVRQPDAQPVSPASSQQSTAHRKPMQAVAGRADTASSDNGFLNRWKHPALLIVPILVILVALFDEAPPKQSQPSKGNRTTTWTNTTTENNPESEPASQVENPLSLQDELQSASARTTAVNKTAEELHYEAIYHSHPDADDIYASTSFRDWASSESYRQNVLNYGTAQDVISLFNDYKVFRAHSVASQMESHGSRQKESQPIRNQCEFKRVMTNADYAACGITPPGSAGR